MSTTTRTHLIERRAELIIELFLQDLSPTYLARSDHDFGYDFLVGFSNPEGGVNTSAVVTKATEQAVKDNVPFPKNRYEELSHSNIPVLLLVANVKTNQLYYAWLTSQQTKGREGAQMISIPVNEVDEQAKKSILRQLSGQTGSLRTRNGS
jgi:hypothetical protein